MNRGKSHLHLHYLNGGLPGKDKILVRSRKVFRPGPGKHTLHFFYDDRTVLLDAPPGGNIHVEDIVSPLDNRYMGKSITLPGDIARMKITCREQFSIASIIEGLEDDRK
ncbi:MAG: hypothetical protein P1P82_06795 [Bacteroidales bacterium]|nr:hypothetical protein [Bacteroidales bacterium]MDT8430523.1 hypothetical protein [Bacteroidales bacterium]